MISKRYSVIVRTDTGVHQTVPIDSLSSVNDRTRRLLHQLVKDGELGLGESYVIHMRVKELLASAKSINDEQNSNAESKMDEVWQGLKDRIDFLK